jgi:tetratricopeptide (TPR) repeat protein
MTPPEVTRAVELLIEQAWADYAGGRYGSAVKAAGRTVQAADQAADPNLQVQALAVEASVLRAQGDSAAALVRYTRMLGMADDPATTARLDAQGIWAVGNAYLFWAESAQFAGGIPVRRLFAVLDAAERWLTAVGHRDWRAGVLHQRAAIHRQLSEWDPAVANAQEALAVHVPGSPGPTLSSHRYQLGDILRDAGRAAEAEPLYRAILDDPGAVANERRVAWQGLAYCALANDDPAAAVRHAAAAVEIADTLGDEALTTTLLALVAALRAGGDLDSARQAATRNIEVARRIGTHYRLFYALRDAVDVALDRADPDAARPLLDELDEHATALDHDNGGDAYTRDTANRRRRLTEPAAHP